MLKKVNNLLNCMIGSFTGVFIGRAIFVYLDYKKNTELYAMQSAPWYTSIITNGIFTIVILAVFIIAKCIIRKK